jgi:pyruvate/2-oxoglutarate dehydrogenase complex dihydrolipoamide dehydrogenase (E3) component
MPTTDTATYDVIVIGAGPAGDNAPTGPCKTV